MSDVFTDRDLRNWVLSLGDQIMSDEAVDMIMQEINERYSVIGSLVDDRMLVDDIPHDDLWELVARATDEHP